MQDIALATIDHQYSLSQRTAPYDAVDTLTWQDTRSHDMSPDDRPSLDLLAQMASRSYRDPNASVEDMGWVTRPIKDLATGGPTGQSVDQYQDQHQYTANEGVYTRNGIPYDVREMWSAKDPSAPSLRIIGGRHGATATPRDSRFRGRSTRPCNSVQDGEYFIMIEPLLPARSTDLAAPTVLVASGIPASAYQSICCGITRNGGTQGLSYTGTSFDPQSQKVFRPSLALPDIETLLDEVVPHIKDSSRSLLEGEASIQPALETTGLLSGKSKSRTHFPRFS
jgi:hypothetical protein